MIWIVLVVIAFAVLGLWCVGKDLKWNLKAKEILIGFMLAATLAVSLNSIVAVWGCSDVEKYSLLWYAMGCWYDEHSR